MEIKKSLDVQIKNSKGVYSKDLMDIEVEVGDRKLRLKDIIMKLDRKEAELEEREKKLELKLKKFEDAEAKVDALLTQSLDVLHKKMARVEVMLKEQEE